MTTRTLRITPDPDFGRLEKVLRRQGVPDRVPFYELFSNIEYEILRAIGKDRNREPIERGDRSREAEWLEQHITYMYSLGYDYVNVGALGFDFPMDGRPKAMTDQGEVAYLQGMTHTIAAREDFETYPWPDGRQADFSLLEQAETSLPDGMKVIGNPCRFFKWEEPTKKSLRPNGKVLSSAPDSGVGLRDRIKKTISKAFNVPLIEMGDVDQSPETIGNWDSFTHISMITFLEAEFNIRIDDSEIGELLNISSIEKTIRKKFLNKCNDSAGR